MTADGEDRRLKEAMLLLSTISLLCKQLPPEGAEFGQVLHWTQRLCTEQTPGGATYCVQLDEIYIIYIYTTCMAPDHG